MINNKVYIGQSNKENERWRQHQYLARQKEPIQYIHRAIKKYGIDNFIYEVIACCITQDNANALEIILIQQYNCRDNECGYNLSPGGDYITGGKPLSEEHKAALRKPKSKTDKMGVKKGNIPWNKGKKGAQKAWNKGLPKEKSHLFGKEKSEESKRKQSESMKKRWAEKKRNTNARRNIN